MGKKLKKLMLRIRRKRPKQVFIYSTKKFDLLWEQMEKEMYKRKLYGGVLFTDIDWCKKGYDNFICKGIPVILKGKNGPTTPKSTC